MKIFWHKIYRNLYKICFLNLRIVTLFSRMKWVFECKRKPFFQNFMCRKNHDKFLKFFNFRETCKRAFQNLKILESLRVKIFMEKGLLFWKKWGNINTRIKQRGKWESSFRRWMGSLRNFTSTHFKISKENLIE